MGSSDSKYQPDPNLSIDENIARAYGTCSNISYNILKSAILPIIAEQVQENETRKLYDDLRLPADFRENCKRLEENAEFEVKLVSIIGVWMGYKLAFNIIKNRNPLKGVSLFDKWVLGCTVPTLIFGYSYVQDFVCGLDFFGIEDLMFKDKKNKYIAMYRKRFVEYHPDYPRLLYSTDKRWLLSDGIDEKIFTFDLIEEKKQGVQENEEELTESQIEYLQSLNLQDTKDRE